MAISTFCRSCGQHFQIENGVALPPFGANDPGPRFRSTATEGKAYEDVGFDETGSSQKAPKKKPAPIPKRSFFGLARLLSSRTEDSTPIEPEKKPVRCFECGHVHEVSIAASSTQCARCSLYISLSNEDIREHYSRNIRTRGNVIIHKKGSVIGSEIACHNLTVLGGISGSVDCSGNATFKNSGKVLGSMHCKHIVIERKCEMDFPQGIIADSADIYGVVRGDILCSGTVNIYKTGSVLGDATAKAIVMKDGGVLTGQMNIQHDINIDLPKKGTAPTATPAEKTAESKAKKQKTVVKKAPAKEPAQPSKKAESPPTSTAEASQQEPTKTAIAGTANKEDRRSDKKTKQQQTPKAPEALKDSQTRDPAAPAKKTASAESPQQDGDNDDAGESFALSSD